MDAFNFLNRSNVDEVTSVYGSPVFCGGAIPHALQGCYQPHHSGRTVAACPFGQIPVIPGGSLAHTPINDLPPGLGPGFVPTTLFIPNNPNPTFGLPRTMLNPREFQFAAKFSF